MERAAIYLFKKKKKFLMHSDSRTKGGPGLATPPYTWMDSTNSDDYIIGQLLYTLSCTKEGLPIPSDWSAFNASFMQSIGLKRNKDLYTDSLLVMVSKENGLIEFSSTVNMGRKGFLFKGPEFNITLPASSSAEELAEALKKAFSECE